MLCAVEKMVVILNLRLCGLFKRIEGRNIAKEIQTDSKKYKYIQNVIVENV